MMFLPGTGWFIIQLFLLVAQLEGSDKLRHQWRFLAREKRQDLVVDHNSTTNPTTTKVEVEIVNNPPDNTGIKYMPQSQAPPGQCTIHARKGKRFSNLVKKKLQDGAKQLKYNLKFYEYVEKDPLKITNTSKSYLFKPNLWSRIKGEHGRKLLSLAFNYDVLSLQMLTFGVEMLDVEILDSPKFCFGSLDDQQKLDLIMDLLVKDFDTETKEEVFLEEDEFLCHHIVQNDDGYGLLKYQCCTKNKQYQPNLAGIKCHVEEKDKWISLVYAFIATMKVAFFLLGPLALQKWIYGHSIRKADYLVKLKQVLRKTLLVHKVFVPDEPCPSEKINRDFPDQFKKLKQLLKVIPSDEVVPVNINRLHIQVNQKDLVTEKIVPVGILQFIWNQFFQCGIIQVEPFLSCCRESIIGSWASKFLFIRLMPRGSECNKSCRNFFSWGHVAYIIAGTVSANYQRFITNLKFNFF